MPAEDPWDEVHVSGCPQSGLDEYQALLWLVNMMSGKDLWMDGTMHWSLPLSVLSGIRAKTAMEAILLAKQKYDNWCNSNKEKDL